MFFWGNSWFPSLFTGTGRRCPTVGWGTTFWRVNRFFFTKTADSRKRKVEKSIRECKIDRLFEGYKRAIDKIRGPIAKRGFFGPNPSFWSQNKRSLFHRNHVPATTRQSCAKKKIPFSQINISLLFCISNLSFLYLVFLVFCISNSKEILTTGWAQLPIKKTFLLSVGRSVGCQTGTRELANELEGKSIEVFFFLFSVFVILYFVVFWRQIMITEYNCIWRIRWRKRKDWKSVDWHHQ